MVKAIVMGVFFIGLIITADMMGGDYERRRARIKKAGRKSDTVLDLSNVQIPKQNPNAANDLMTWRCFIGYLSKRGAQEQVYSGAITKVKAVLCRHTKGGEYPMYEVTIGYGDKKTAHCLRSIEYDPRIILENPYCTVTVCGPKCVAKDFKIKPCYINEKGEVTGEEYILLYREEILEDLREEKRAGEMVKSIKLQMEEKERKRIREMQKRLKRGKPVPGDKDYI